MSVDYLFKCTTNDAYVIKTLIELLHHTIKIACFQITPVGISLRMMDRNQQLLIDCSLKSENFFMYHFSTKVENQCINIGINLNHFYRMLKSIKKRDSLSLYIEENNISDCILMGDYSGTLGSMDENREDIKTIVSTIGDGETVTRLADCDEPGRIEGNVLHPIKAFGADIGGGDDRRQIGAHEGDKTVRVGAVERLVVPQMHREIR